MDARDRRVAGSPLGQPSSKSQGARPGLPSLLVTPVMWHAWMSGDHPSLSRVPSAKGKCVGGIMKETDSGYQAAAWVSRGGVSFWPALVGSRGRLLAEITDPTVSSTEHRRREEPLWETRGCCRLFAATGKGSLAIQTPVYHFWRVDGIANPLRLCDVLGSTLLRRGPLRTRRAPRRQPTQDSPMPTRIRSTAEQ